MSDYYYLPSSNIDIFPVGDRSASYSHNRLLNEQNLTNMFKGLTSKPSYVLSYNDDVIKFVLAGRHIECELTDSCYALLSSSEPFLYARIDISNGAINKTDTVAPVAGAIPEYQGVGFFASNSSTETFSGSTYAQLHILTLDTTSNPVTYVVPQYSYFKHSGRDIYINDLSGNDVSLQQHIEDVTLDLEQYIEIYTQIKNAQIDSRLQWKKYGETVSSVSELQDGTYTVFIGTTEYTVVVSDSRIQTITPKT